MTHDEILQEVQDVFDKGQKDQAVVQLALATRADHALIGTRKYAKMCSGPIGQHAIRTDEWIKLLPKNKD